MRACLQRESLQEILNIDDLKSSLFLIHFLGAGFESLKPHLPSLITLILAVRNFTSDSRLLK